MQFTENYQEIFLIIISSLSKRESMSSALKVLFALTLEINFSFAPNSGFYPSQDTQDSCEWHNHLKWYDKAKQVLISKLSAVDE